jgi:hypothetical protein
MGNKAIVHRYKQIIKDCFWEYKFTEEDIDNMFKSSNEREKQFLFEKILLNSKELFNDMSLFNKRDLQTMLHKYLVPKFNREYINRRKNILEYYFFNKSLEVNELKWNI